MFQKSVYCNALDTVTIIEKLRELDFTEEQIDLIIINVGLVAELKQLFSAIPEDITVQSNPYFFKNTILAFCKFFPVLQHLYISAGLTDDSKN